MSKPLLSRNSYPIRYDVPLLDGWSQHSEPSAAGLADLSKLLAYCEDNKSLLDREIAGLEGALRQAHVERAVTVKKIEVLARLNADLVVIRQTPWDRLAASMMTDRDKPAPLDATSACAESAGAAVASRRPIWRYVGWVLLVVLLMVLVTSPPILSKQKRSRILTQLSQLAR